MRKAAACITIWPMLKLCRNKQVTSWIGEISAIEESIKGTLLPWAEGAFWRIGRADRDRFYGRERRISSCAVGLLQHDVQAEQGVTTDADMGGVRKGGRKARGDTQAGTWDKKILYFNFFERKYLEILAMQRREKMRNRPTDFHYKRKSIPEKTI